MAAPDTGSAAERKTLAVGLEQVDHGKGEVLRIGAEGDSTPLTGIAHSAGVRGVGGQLSQQSHLPLPDDALGVVGVGR